MFLECRMTRSMRLFFFRRIMRLGCSLPFILVEPRYRYVKCFSESLLTRANFLCFPSNLWTLCSRLSFLPALDSITFERCDLLLATLTAEKGGFFVTNWRTLRTVASDIPMRLTRLLLCLNLLALRNFPTFLWKLSWFSFLSELVEMDVSGHWPSVDITPFLRTEVHTSASLVKESTSSGKLPTKTKSRVSCWGWTVAGKMTRKMHKELRQRMIEELQSSKQSNTKSVINHVSLLCHIARNR